MRTILLVNKSTLISRYAFGQYAAAQQRQISEHFAPIYGIDVQLRVADDHQADEEAVVFMDHPDVADALGYHQVVESSETPLGFVFPALSQQYHTAWSSVGSHEVLEQAKDAFCQQGQVGTWEGKVAAIADEVADPVQADVYQMDGVWLSNFVRPSWFNEEAKDPRGYDYLANLTSPCTLRPGGYISLTFDLRTWNQVFAYRHPMAGYRFHEGVVRYARRSRRGKHGPFYIQRPKK